MPRRLIALAALASLLAASPAYAEIWLATCIDGKNIRFVHQVGEVGALSMQINVGEGVPPAVIQIAALEQTFYDGEMVCSAVVGHRRTFADEPVSELCADNVNSVILVKY